MRPLTVAFTLVTVAGCGSGPCANGTLFLTLSFVGGAQNADRLDIVRTVDDGLPQHAPPVRRTPGPSSDTIPLGFAAGYPAGHRITLTIVALAAGAPIATAVDSFTAASRCTARSLTLDGNAGDLAVGDLAVGDLALGDLAMPVVATSCAGGTNQICGPSGAGDCCQSPLVPMGMYNRSNDPMYRATVSDFRLDKYEITVGRFRAFVNAGMGTKLHPPEPNTGAHPRIAGSGWNSTMWNSNLSDDTTQLKANLQTNRNQNPACCWTWTDPPGPNENHPITNITWYEAFAFCIWDGGFLPTEAEWNYAAAGGSEQLPYPWSQSSSDVTIDMNYAVYAHAPGVLSAFVGSKSIQGDGKWGQSDLAGNVWEWTLDSFVDPYTTPCNDCAYLGAGAGRVQRGGAYDTDASKLLTSDRSYHDAPTARWYTYGARCARNP